MNQLTLKSKKLIVVASVVAGAVIGTLGLLLTLSPGTESRAPVAAIVLMVLAALSVGVLAASRITRHRQVRGLGREYLEAYEGLADALVHSTFSLAERKEIQLDILGLLADADRHGRPASEVLGEDAPAFVRNVQSAYGYQGKVGFYILGGVQYLIFLLTVVQTAVYFTRDTLLFLETTIGVQQIPFGMLICFVLIPLMHRAVAREQVFTMMALPLGIVVLYIATHELFRTYFADAAWAAYYLDAEVGYISSWPAAAALLATFGAALLGKMLLRKRALSRVQMT